MVVRVRDVTIRADEEGIWGYWTEGSWSEQHHVLVSSPDPPTAASTPDGLVTTGSSGFHIPSSKLASFSLIELTIASYESDGSLFNVSISLEQVPSGVQ